MRRQEPVELHGAGGWGVRVGCRHRVRGLVVVGAELPLGGLAQLGVVIAAVHLDKRRGGPDEEGEEDDLHTREER